MRLAKHLAHAGVASRRASEQLIFDGRVEIDDAYLGGERSGGKADRGSQNKMAFVVAVQTTDAACAHLACLSARPFTKEAM